MNDRFLMRGAAGIPYEFLWAIPYQPGLSYHHVPLAFHDEIGGQLFVRSSWEDDAAWAGFFGGQLQVFEDGAITAIDPKQTRDPLDLQSAVVFFAREAKRFKAPGRERRPRCRQRRRQCRGRGKIVFSWGSNPAARITLKLTARTWWKSSPIPVASSIFPAYLRR